MVDTGLKKNWKSIQKNLDKLLNGNELDFLVITHTHYDCVENVSAIKKKYSPAIIIHKKEAEYLSEGTSAPLPEWAYKIGAKINNCPTVKHYFDPVNADIVVDDELNLSPFGINGRIISTPGHSVGSTSIIVDNIALVCSALSGMKKKPYAKSINVASIEAENTWQKLISLGLERYIPRHGNVEYTIDDIKNMYKGYKNLVYKS
jgi:glyoxylase-like metal-dependent hydrolase (beta-lactamase superfamily II)